MNTRPVDSGKNQILVDFFRKTWEGGIVFHNFVFHHVFMPFIPSKQSSPFVVMHFPIWKTTQIFGDRIFSITRVLI